MTSPRRFVSFLPSFAAVVLLALLSSACAPKDNVRLIYNPNAPTALPAPTAASVAVVLFEDKRGKADIGIKRNGSPFRADSPVAPWISRSLADEVSRLGPQVSYADTVQQAQAARPDFIVTGRVDEVWLKEVGTATYSATIKISVSMANPKGVVYNQNLISAQEKTGLPNTSMVEGVLTDALREVLGVAASQIAERTSR